MWNFECLVSNVTLVVMLSFLVSSYEFLLCVSSLQSPSCYRWFQVVPARSRSFKLVLSGSSSFLLLVYTEIVNRETKRSQHNEISLNLLLCDYFSTIFTHYLEILSKYNQIYIMAYNIGLVFSFSGTDVYWIANIMQ